jgi:N6-adenosine-specific RNA methylase IME4
MMDPPWKIRMGLRYPLLTMTQIFEIPLDILQDRGFVMIWVLADNEDRVIQKMAAKGYKKYGKVVWLKCSENRIPVNFIGKL